MSIIINGNATINKNSTFNNSLRYGNTDILQKEATGKELVTAKWVKENYSTAPSPYIHTFSGTSTTIPYNKIRGLKWLKIYYYYTMGGVFTYVVSTGINTCVSGKHGKECGSDTHLKTKKVNIDSISNFDSNGNSSFSAQICWFCSFRSNWSCTTSQPLNFTYNRKSGLLKFSPLYCQGATFNYFNSVSLRFYES